MGVVPSLPQGSQTTIQLEHSPKLLAQNQDRIKNVEVYRHFRICAIPPPLRTQEQQSNSITPPTVWHKNQDKIKTIEVFKHFRNCAHTPLRARQGPKTTIHL